MIVPERARGVRVEVTGTVEKRCPHRDELDRGEVTISWTTDGMTFELHQLNALLGTYAHATISHEEFSDDLRAGLASRVGVKDVTVSSKWTTGGLDVECSTSPTPAAQR